MRLDRGTDLERWFFPMASVPATGLPLLCLPHAGAGATAYRTWPAALAPHARVVPVQLPGRETRFGEPPARRVGPLMAELADAVVRFPAARDGYALFGHSMGALLAFELAHELTARGLPPAHLFVSGYRAPQLPRMTRNIHLRDDAGLLAHLRELAGAGEEALAHPGLMAALLPTIRADFEMCETYRYVTRSPLTVPLTAFGGRHDPGVPAADLLAWAEACAGPFRAGLFDGGHLYLRERRDELLSALVTALTA